MRSVILCFAAFMMLPSCADRGYKPPVTHVRLPSIDSLAIIPAADTLRFPLDEDSFGDIESWSIRQQHGETIIAFFDQRSESILEYQYPSCRLMNKILLRNVFSANSINSAYLHTYDSIFLLSKNAFYLTDSSLQVHKKVLYAEANGGMQPEISPMHPPVIRNGKLYLSRYPDISSASRKAFRQWRVLWIADQQTGTVTSDYPLPDTYQGNSYENKLLRYNFCINASGSFVFNFPADTMLYETDLGQLHNAWYARSGHQARPALASLQNNAGDQTDDTPASQDSAIYTGIYYDAFHQRYLRIVRSGRERVNGTLRFLILDKGFRIIGESDVPDGIQVKELLFTPDGHIYARIQPKNEYEIPFIRLEYYHHPTARHAYEK
ncbi:DUF4221 family protein [Chitinophaga deserti]|uniref:DUF4221 family protein n=1 Tax=Chitinophaga deserti TaxID=2164099 RepID=UPI000D6A89CA|nr:DUF4221 family protein [Chitinophaga deserti]